MTEDREQMTEDKKYHSALSTCPLSSVFFSMAPET